jgi:glycosyltransferase involved in cell wall biosynthesis
MANQRRIILVSNTAFSLYNFRLSLARTLKNNHFEVYMVAPEDNYSEELKKEFIFLPLKNLNRKGKNPLKDFKLFHELLSIYRKIKPNIVIHYTIKPNIYGSLACGILGIPSIAVITGLGYVFTNKTKLQKIVEILYKTSLKRANFVVFLNNIDMEEFLRKGLIPKDRIVSIPGEGIDTDKFNPEFCKKSSKSDDLTFLMISRLLWDKGVKEYVESAKIIKSKYENTKFLLLGPFDKGNPNMVPEDYILKHHKEGIITYLGEAKDVRPFICQSDVVVLPSYREGIPRVLLEAMSMAKSIITTDAPGCRDTVIDGYNGFLVKVKDIVSLTDAIERMIKMDKVELKLMGERGRKMVIENFSDEVVIGKMISLINKILKNDQV